MDKAQHFKEIEGEGAIKGPAIDDSDAAAGLMLLCSELSSERSANEKLVRELSMSASLNCGSEQEEAQPVHCPNCHAVLSTHSAGGKDVESPASVIAWQWGEVAVCACMAGSSSAEVVAPSSAPQDASGEPASSAPKPKPAESSGWNAGVVRELMQAPPPTPSKSFSALKLSTSLPPRPPLPPQSVGVRFSARRKEKNETAAAMDILEMREEIMTDQRLIAELAQAALLPDIKFPPSPLPTERPEHPGPIPVDST